MDLLCSLVCRVLCYDVTGQCCVQTYVEEFTVVKIYYSSNPRGILWCSRAWLLVSSAHCKAYSDDTRQVCEMAFRKARVELCTNAAFKLGFIIMSIRPFWGIVWLRCHINGVPYWETVEKRLKFAIWRECSLRNNAA